jgi:hypothetical protein
MVTTLFTLRTNIPGTIMGTFVGNIVSNNIKGTGIVSGRNNFNPFVAASTYVKPAVIPAKENDVKKTTGL